MNRTLGIIALILGIIFLGLAVLYWATPANHLPVFLPGYSAAVTSVHFKHGLLAFILALLLFAYAWFATGEKN